jgi:hypothetical protein
MHLQSFLGRKTRYAPFQYIMVHCIYIMTDEGASQSWWLSFYNSCIDRKTEERSRDVSNQEYYFFPKQTSWSRLETYFISHILRHNEGRE